MRYRIITRVITEEVWYFVEVFKKIGWHRPFRGNWIQQNKAFRSPEEAEEWIKGKRERDERINMLKRIYDKKVVKEGII